MTNYEKKMRKNWFDFRKKNPLNRSEEKIYLSKEQINSVFSNLFK